MLEVSHRPSLVSRSQSALTDDEALQILFQANTPNPGGSWSPSRCATPASGRPFTPNAPGVRLITPGGRSSSPGRSSSRRRKSTRSASPAAQTVKEDEEAAHTRRFWENWAAEATKALLANATEPADQGMQIIFSGQCGPEPRFGMMKRSESQESLKTDISLFNCSEINAKDLSKRPRKAKKRKSAKPKAPEINWEIFAKERKGLLDKFIQADASRIQGYMKGRTAPIENVIQRVKATDVMSKYERRLLRNCAYGRGLHLAEGNSKSYSTENIVSVLKATQRLHQQKSVTFQPGGAGGSDDSGDEERNGDVPSPAAIVESTKTDRPDSAMPALNPVEEVEGSSRASSAASSRLSWGGATVFTQMPTRSVRYEASQAPSPAPTMATHRTQHARRRFGSVHGLPDLEGNFTGKVRRRIQGTINDLTKATGFGDHTDVSMPIIEEQGLYTEADYARHPRYPQNIRIAPHLSKVIRDDIRDRMGRPRRHEVRVQDLQAYDAEQPELGRSHRNLVIFNWLNVVSESPYEQLSVPDIVDLEGEPPKRTYPKFKPGIVGEEDAVSLGTPVSASCRDDDDVGSDISRSDFDSNDSFYD